MFVALCLFRWSPLVYEFASSTVESMEAKMNKYTLKWLSLHPGLFDVALYCRQARLEKKLDGNYTRMLRAIFNKSWRQHPTRHQLYGHLPPITKTIQVRRTRHVGHCWRNKDELIGDVLPWTPHMSGQKQDDQFEHTYRSYVRIRDVALKTCQRQWTIGRSGERGQGYPC